MAPDVFCNGSHSHTSGNLLNGASEKGETGAEKRLVLKFGGTVCGRLPEEVAEIYSPLADRPRSALREGPIAVVCSARSGKTKEEGTTNRLLKAARLAFRGELAECKETVLGILSQHVQGTSILSSAQAAKLVGIFTEECDRLAKTLAEIAQQPTLSRKRSARAELEDQVLGLGEKFSTLFLTAMLEDRGVLAEYIDLSHVVDANPHQALTPEFYQHISESIGRTVQACGDRVPVITGFFGKVPGGLLESCGRGYSDLLAALVAVGVDARELQIWKEVSGVYTADPRKVPTAYLLPSIHPSEANELTFYGSEVLHHFTIEQCIPRIPIRIKNVREPDGSGTLIFLDDKKKDDPFYDQRPRRPTAVTVKQHITVVNVHSNRKVGSPEFLAKICGKLSEHSLSVDLFELNECHVSLAVHSRSAFITMTGKKNQEEIESQHVNLMNAIEDLKKFGSVEVVHNMAILSLIGKGLKRSCGMAGKLFSALGDNNINIEMISQGASEINISCVITERDSLRALNVVHTELFTFIDL